MNEKRKEKMDCITKMLQEGVESVFCSERYADWLRVCSRFHRYSLNNQILILMQAPFSSQVAGYRAWQDMGRQVKKGEHGIMIMAPMKIKGKKDDPDHTEENDLLLFKPVTVFDISQTEGPDLPSLTSELTGDSRSFGHVIEQLCRFSIVPIRFTDELPPGVYGCFSSAEHAIRVRASIHGQHKVKTLIHEIAHSLLDGDPNNRIDRQSMEVRAESIAFVVCNAIGIDTGEYSFGYIAGWSSGKEMDELKATMQDIRQVSDQILSHLLPAA